MIVRPIVVLNKVYVNQVTKYFPLIRHHLTVQNPYPYSHCEDTHKVPA